ncbi:hypothetical protein [Erythrobacter sp. R86502]|uniref:hypothetical protein n=1 Tax=Erythrobacter sp. R86502 TaxID=3093846 RepID=UPI0036D22319
MADAALTEVPILILGESHSTAISRAIEIEEDIPFVSIDVRTGSDKSKINYELFSFYRPEKLVLAFGGTEHNIIGMIEGEPKYDFLWPPFDDFDTERTLIPASAIEEILALRIKSGLRRALRVRELFDCPVFALAPPPPFLAIDDAAALPKAFASLLEAGIAPAPIRRKLYAVQCAVMQSHYGSHDIPLISAPKKACDANGYILRKLWGRDPTHGNRHYGRILVQHLRDKLGVKENAAEKKTDD